MLNVLQEFPAWQRMGRGDAAARADVGECRFMLAFDGGGGRHQAWLLIARGAATECGRLSSLYFAGAVSAQTTAPAAASASISAPE